jgi:pantoate--beta-alanine ligase
VVELVDKVDDVRKAVSEARERRQRVGLVPTMGALHEGHVRLIEECRAITDLVVVSIFVNPTQFGAGEDFDRYPRSLEYDRQQSEAGGAGLVFAPSVATIYPHGSRSTFVEVPGLSDVLEGASRPGHFRGVATVVLKLFEVVRPDVAFFGQKDYQQQLVIRRMVEDLHVPVEVRIAATVREHDGLALSSRNRYLNPGERQAAAVLYRALEHARAAVTAGERRADRVRQILVETLESDSLVKPDYVEVADADTLEPLGVLHKDQKAVAILAARVGTTRLIDNALLSVDTGPASIAGV